MAKIVDIALLMIDSIHASVGQACKDVGRAGYCANWMTFINEDSPMANLMLSVMGEVTEFKRALIRERQRELV